MCQSEDQIIDLKRINTLADIIKQVCVKNWLHLEVQHTFHPPSFSLYLYHRHLPRDVAKQPMAFLDVFIFQIPSPVPHKHRHLAVFSMNKCVKKTKTKQQSTQSVSPVWPTND